MPDSQLTTRAAWRKSSYSSGNSACVEMAQVDDNIAVRDSKDPHGPHLRFTQVEMAAWIRGVKVGEFDDLA